MFVITIEKGWRPLTLNSPVWSSEEWAAKCGVSVLGEFPALAQGLIGNHDVHASKMETIVDELSNWWEVVRKLGRMEVWKMHILVAALFRLDYYKPARWKRGLAIFNEQWMIFKFCPALRILLQYLLLSRAMKKYRPCRALTWCVDSDPWAYTHGDEKSRSSRAIHQVC